MVGVSPARRAPLKPLTLADGGRVRKEVHAAARNLFGSLCPDANLQLADDFLRRSLQNFKQRWNFDPVTWKPLNSAQARIEWTVLDTGPQPGDTDGSAPVHLNLSEEVSSQANEKEAQVETNAGQLTLKGHHDMPGHVSWVTCNEDNAVRSCALTLQPSPASNEKKMKQTKITDFAAIVKRPSRKPVKRLTSSASARRRILLS